MFRSDSITELAAALAVAQGMFKPAIKSTENPFFHSKYAPLDAIWESVRQGLSENGLAVIQGTILDETSGCLMLETILAHESGEWISSVCPVKPAKDDPQGLGSALTYIRRYAFSAMVGAVAAGEDDDANQASGKTESKPAAAPGSHSEQPQQEGQPQEPEPNRKALTAKLCQAAVKFGFVAKDKDPQGRDKTDFQKLNHYLVHDLGLPTGYVADLSIDEIKLATSKLLEGLNFTKPQEEQGAN